MWGMGGLAQTLRLQQVEFFRSFDGLVAAVSIELAVDALNVSLDRVHGNDQLFCNLWTGEIRAQPAQHLKLAVAEGIEEQGSGR